MNELRQQIEFESERFFLCILNNQLHSFHTNFSFNLFFTELRLETTHGDGVRVFMGR